MKRFIATLMLMGAFAAYGQDYVVRQAGVKPG
jgi:hypothetical protein